MLAFYLSLIDNENDKLRFEEVYHTYKKQMAFLAKSILKNHHDAEDVVHDVFCSVASSHMDIITNAATEDDVRNYLLKSVKNASISLIRKRKVRSDYEDKKRSEKSELNDTEFLDRICDKFELEEFIAKLELIDEKYREVLYYRIVLEMSAIEISKIVNRPPNTVRQQIARAKNLVLALYTDKEEE